VSGPYVEQTAEPGEAATRVRDEVSALREYLKWLASYAAIPGDSAFDRRLEMARAAVDRVAALVAAAEERGARAERERIVSGLRRFADAEQQIAKLTRSGYTIASTVRWAAERVAKDELS